ncbi:hypothetical protein FRC05_003289 [Tulasnella sp. 425]|nr:hypothetical protein FRC05_003289 [Tulasnella sp. 425]
METKTRQRTAAMAFTKWLQQNSIPEDVFIPTTRELCDWEPIRALVANPPFTETVPSELFINAMNEGQDFLKGYDYKVRARVLDQIIHAGGCPKSDPTGTTDFAPLYLATSVLMCSEGKLRDGPPLH